VARNREVRALIDGNVVAPGTPVGAEAGPDDGWVYCDKRSQQMNQNFLSIIKELADLAELKTPDELYLELILSALSAHSIDFVVGDVGGADHTLKVEWAFEDSDDDEANAALCLGPSMGDRRTG
jgi:hypothetical protein